MNRDLDIIIEKIGNEKKVNIEDLYRFTATPEQLDEVASVLSNRGIKIVELEDKQTEKNILSDDFVAKYLKEISGFDVLTPAEENKLFIEYVNGNHNLKNKLINSNLKLVVSVAKRYKNVVIDMPALSFLDLIQYGNIGLIKAIDKYDPYTGNKFSSYATWWIMQEITRAITDHKQLIRVPSHVQLQINKFENYKKNYVMENMKEPSINDYCKYFNMRQEQVENILLSTKGMVSMNDTIKDNSEEGSNITVGECLVAECNVEEEAINKIRIKRILEVAKKVLTEREYDVVMTRVGLKTGEAETLEQIGKKYDITREAVRLIEKKAYKKIIKNY